MLEKCAPGFTATETVHYWCVRFNTKSYPSLPKGEHGKSDPEIQVGKIKQMARQLGIEDCAKNNLSLLAK
jgi:hypothetical protein